LEKEKTPKLERKVCRNCGKRVTATSDRSEESNATGMFAYRKGKKVGAVCFKCAEKMIDFSELYGTKVVGHLESHDGNPMEFHYH